LVECFHGDLPGVTTGSPNTYNATVDLAIQRLEQVAGAPGTLHAQLVFDGETS